MKKQRPEFLPCPKCGTLIKFHSDQWVTVSKITSNPIVHVLHIKHQTTVIEISLEQFIDALKTEIDSVTWVFTDTEFRRRVDEAVKTIIEGMKQETIRAVT